MKRALQAERMQRSNDRPHRSLILVPVVVCLAVMLCRANPSVGQDAKPAEAKPLKATETNRSRETGLGNIYCGPRCVQRVLREYDIETELIDLIREMQWPDVEKGSTLAALSAALNERGISTKAVELDPKFDIEWSHPAIVHLEKDGIAHFVVWLPPTDPNSSGRVWDNDLTDAVKRGKFNGLRSGPVLLTSDTTIPDSTVVGRRIRSLEPAQYFKSVLPWALSLAGFSVGWLLQRRSSLRRKSS